MIYPTFSELTKDEFNRYQLAIATAKCARMVTDEYVKQREEAEKAIAGVKESDKSMVNMIDKELKDEKAVKIAINRIHKGEYKIVESDVTESAEAEVADGESAETTEE
jgi:DNA-directed RNA polymerase subunit K/omega